MGWEAENEVLMRTEPGATKGFTITRGKDAHPHAGRKQRGADAPDL